MQRIGGKGTSPPATGSWRSSGSVDWRTTRFCLPDGVAIQQEVKQRAVEVHERDGVELLLRVGLISGQVIAGEIGPDLSVTHHW